MMSQTVLVRVVSRCPARLRRWRAAWLVGMVWSLGLVSGVPAATTWTVCASGCDYSSIKAAIGAPTTLDGDTLAIAAGTYTEAGITVDKSLTLQGESAASTIVQAATTKGTAPDRVFALPSGVTVAMQSLTLRNGRAIVYIPGSLGSGNFGGGIYNAGTLTLTNSTISGNRASAGGGLTNQGTLTLTNSTVMGNAADTQGGGLVNYGTLTLINSTVRDNSSGRHSDGGGVYNAGLLTLTNSTVSGNSAQGGGGIANYQGGQVTLTASTVSDNSADGDTGGGLKNGQGSLTLINSTVSGNSATAYGGGLEGEGWTRLINSTVAGNSAPRAGGLAIVVYKAMFTNSIIANNLPGGDCLTLYGGSITSQGYNLDSDRSCQLTAATDHPGVDPLLGPLQSNGGLTRTHALLPDSPAIDAIPWGTNGCGTSRIGDQRWHARPQPAGGACDIGAYEVVVAGQALGGWVTGMTPRTAVCQNVTTGQEVMLSASVSPWDCEAAGLGVTPGDQVALRVRGPVKKGAKDVGGAVAGMTPSGGGCTNRTTGQQVTFQALFQGQRGATAASCVAAGLVVQPGEIVQLRVQGVAE